MNFKKYIFGALFVAAVAVFAAQPAMAHSIKDLPPGLKKTSGVVPGMGEHYLNPKSKTIYGGYQGKIVFIEYEVAVSEMTGDENKFWDKEKIPSFVGKIDHIDLEYLGKGHPGMTLPHFVIHAYTVSHATHKAFRPPKK